MKKIFITLTVLTVLLVTGCSVRNDELYNKLKTQYPDAEIKQYGAGFDVITEFDNFDWLDNEVSTCHSCGPNRGYETFEELIGALSPDVSCVFLGRKTGESKQLIPVQSIHYDTHFTESKVEVIEPYYGDIKKGQKIIFYEPFAVFSEQDGTSKINCDAPYIPSDNSIKIFFVSSNEDAKLYEGKRYESFSSPVKPDENSTDEMTAKLTQKYYINKDTAINKKETAKNIAQKIQNTYKPILGRIQGEKKELYHKVCEVLNQAEPTYWDLCDALGEEYETAIKRLAAQYGETDKSMTSVSLEE